MSRLLPPAENMKLITLAEMARGGMGSIHLARVEGGRFDGRHFAIKRLHENIAKDPQFVAMFLDEAWMTAALRSPNVVEVAAWGNDEEGMFLAVELVLGVSITRLIKEARQNGEIVAERTAAFIGSEVCAGLAAAHGLRGPEGALLGLVHRDLTPSNILASFEGDVKIVDFGIAKAEERITQTKSGELKGKPGYMAPEQARGGKVDARADLFSFGVLMFEMLAGRKPWNSKSAFDVILESATQPPADLASLRKGLSPLLVEVVNKCLEKDPERRYASAVEIQARLDEWRHSKGFGADDRASLAQFTKRNCARQIEWFERAMRGELARGATKTLQELQDEIDDARAKAEKKGALARPAAGEEAPTRIYPPEPAMPRSSAFPAAAPASIHMGNELRPASTSSMPPPNLPRASSSAPPPMLRAAEMRVETSSSTPPEASSSRAVAPRAAATPPPKPSRALLWVLIVMLLVAVIVGVFVWQIRARGRAMVGATETGAQTTDRAKTPAEPNAAGEVSPNEPSAATKTSELPGTANVGEVGGGEVPGK